MNTPRLVAAATIINCLFMIGAWSGLAAPRPTQVVRAQAFELVDSAGNVRAQIHLGEDGSGQIRLRSGKGEVAVKLGALREGGSALLLMDPSVEPGITLAARPTGPAIITTHGGASRTIAP